MVKLLYNVFFVFPTENHRIVGFFVLDEVREVNSYLGGHYSPLQLGQCGHSVV